MIIENNKQNGHSNNVDNTIIIPINYGTISICSGKSND